MNEKELYNLKRNPAKYTNRKSAFNSLEHYVKSCFTVILGCDNKYWVVCFSDAMKLQRAEYELAE